jgi:hypothetical protein
MRTNRSFAYSEAGCYHRPNFDGAALIGRGDAECNADYRHSNNVDLLRILCNRGPQHFQSPRGPATRLLRELPSTDRICQTTEPLQG